MSVIFFEEDYDRVVSEFTGDSPIQTIRQNVCDQIKTQANLVFSSMKAVQTSVHAAERVAQSFLTSMEWSPTSLVKTLANKAIDEAKKTIPKVPKEWDEVARIMNACNFLSSTVFTEPSSLAGSIQSFMVKSSRKLVTDITGELPEFSAAKLLDLIKQQLNVASFKINLDNYKKAIACMSTVCHVDIRPRAAELNAFLKRIYMTGSGELNIVALMKGCGITDPSKVLSISYALATYQSIEDSISESVDEGKKFLNSYF